LAALKTANVGPEKRPILTHCQILGEDLVSRMREQGVIGNIQPSFTVTDAAYVRKRLQDDIIPFSYCWKRMLDSGVACAGGSDAPIETCNPFQGMYDAIHRRKPNRPEDVFLPEECLSFDQALALYTKGGAYAVMEENKLGQLAPGFHADFVVLRKDVTQNHEALVAPDLVESVWVNGRNTYQYDPAENGANNTQLDLSNSLLPGKNGPMRVCRCCRR
jgi:predicted amidohydrolase YtcJ